MMKGYRTVAFNLVSAIVPLISITEWREVIPDTYLPWWLLFIALGNVYLRTITTTPIGRKC